MAYKLKVQGTDAILNEYHKTANIHESIDEMGDRLRKEKTERVNLGTATQQDRTFLWCMDALDAPLAKRRTLLDKLLGRTRYYNTK